MHAAGGRGGWVGQWPSVRSAPWDHLGLLMQKEMIGGWCDTSVNELQVTPRFRVPLLVVTTTTVGGRGGAQHGVID